MRKKTSVYYVVKKNPPQVVGPEGAVEKRGEKRAISF